jgi:hypothetical protein
MAEQTGRQCEFVAHVFTHCALSTLLEQCIGFELLRTDKSVFFFLFSPVDACSPHKAVKHVVNWMFIC